MSLSAPPPPPPEPADAPAATQGPAANQGPAIQPPAPHATDLAAPQRQSLWAIVLLAIRTLRQVGVVQLIIAAGFVLTRVPSVLILVGVVLAVGVLFMVLATLQWLRYTFAIAGDELVVNKGVLNQQRLTIPLDRVQSVSLEQKLLHRVVSLVQVQLDTAGTESSEFIIDAVDRPVAEALQRAVANHRATVAEAAQRMTQAARAAETVVIQHTAGRVLAIALTQLPFAGLVVAWPILAAADSLQSALDWLPVDLPEIETLEPGRWLVWAIPVALVVGLLLSVLLNIIRVFLSDWNLTLTSTEAGLRRNAGLLSTTSVAATVPRVQLLRTSQGVLERTARLYDLNMKIIGQTGMSIPGCDLDQAGEVRRIVMQDAPHPDLAERISRDEIFKNTRNASVVAALATAALWAPFGPYGLISLLLVPLAWAATRRRVRFYRWGLSTDTLADYEKFLGWTRREILLRKVNGVTVRQSLFERKRELATITLDTAQGSISVGMIPHDRAQRLRDAVLYHVETDHRTWM